MTRLLRRYDLTFGNVWARHGAAVVAPPAPATGPDTDPLVRSVPISRTVPLPARL